MQIMKMKFIFDDFFRYVFAVRVDTININNGKYSIPMEYKRCNLIRRVDSGQEELKQKYLRYVMAFMQGVVESAF